jgi:zinc protease
VSSVTDRNDDVRTFRLDSGLTVVAAPRRGSPVVAIQAWVGAGSADEAGAQAGIAHVVEHMVFKGTVRRGVGEMTAEVERAGGDVNAWTSFDHTVFHLVLGRGGLETGLDILADTLLGATFDEGELEREREVIVEEIRQGLDDPARTAGHALFSTAYVIHPYRRPVIGAIESVRGLGREDLLAFHRGAYVAENMTIVVAGDLSAEEARDEVARHFASARRGPASRRRPHEPAQVAPRGVVATHAATEAHLAIGFHAPPLRAPDTALLDLAAIAIGQGESSRLAQLRHRDGTVTGVIAHLHALRDPGLFVISATARPDRIDDAAVALAGSLSEATAELGAAELERARSAVLADQIWQRETAEGLAKKVGWAHATAGDVEFDREYLARVESARVDDVRAAMRRHLRIEQATIAAVVPPRATLRSPEARGRAATRLVERMARGSKPRTRPRKGAPNAGVGARAGGGKAGASAGAVTREVLDNGLRVLVMKDPSVSVVAMRAVWPGGTRLETDDTSGTTSLLSSVITRGCGERDADEFAAEVDRLAGGIAGVGGRNSFGLRAEWLARDWEAGLDLLADCVLAPRFDQAEVERQRGLLLDDLAARAGSGSHQAFRLFAETLYGRHPYHLDTLGSPDAVADLTARKVARFYKDHFPASGMTLAIVGDVDPTAVIEKVRARFGGAPKRKAAAPKIPRATFDGRAAGDREVYRYLPREQAHVVIGFPGATVASTDRFALEVLTSILGGQSGRLFAELRDRQALAYRVSAFSVDGLDPGYLAVYVSCAPEKVDAAVAAIRSEIDRLVADGVTDAEVDRAVRYLTGAHAVAMQRRSAIANALAFHEAYGLGWQSWARYAEDLATVDAGAVAKAARRYLDWDVAVTATVRPPTETAAVKKRMKGVVKKKPAKRRSRPSRRQVPTS